jgi:uncharacterized protein (TIGR00369 family)
MDRHASFTSDFDVPHFIKVITGHGHDRAIGLRYVQHGANWCELELPYERDMASDVVSGILASGPIFTLMDAATSISVFLKRKEFRPQATLDLRIDYLRPATPGKPVIGRGECYRVTSSVAFVRGVAHDGDPEKPVAHVAGTYFFTGQ